MNPITPVLNEIHRILSPGGKFAALVNGPMDVAPGYSDVYNLIYEYVQAKLPRYGEVDLGDPRIRSKDSLKNLLSETFPSANISIETSLVSMEGPITEVAETTAGFFYASFILSSEIRKVMLSKLSDLLTISKQNRYSDRQGRFSMPINRLIIRN
tara:strand:- start:311 stop:775 length:465 start_codon:yes stop_codon:yes gene_type:complete